MSLPPVHLIMGRSRGKLYHEKEKKHEDIIWLPLLVCLSKGNSIIKHKNVYIMKKFFLFVSLALAISSCTTSYKTASVNAISGQVVSVATADLQVSDKKITYTYNTTGAVRRGGLANIKATAISEALKVNGGGDILLECQEAIIKKKGLFGTKIESITVTGYPAVYTNFKTANPSDYEKFAPANTTHKITPRLGLFQ